MNSAQKLAHARMLATLPVKTHHEMFPSRQVRESNKVKAKAAEVRRKRKTAIPVFLNSHSKRMEWP